MQSKTSTQSHALRIEAQPIGLFETPIAYGRLKDADEVMKELEDVIRKRKTVSKGLVDLTWEAGTPKVTCSNGVALRHRGLLRPQSKLPSG